MNFHCGVCSPKPKESLRRRLRLLRLRVVSNFGDSGDKHARENGLPRGVDPIFMHACFLLEMPKLKTTRSLRLLKTILNARLCVPSIY